jgi:hypothetical protein
MQARGRGVVRPPIGIAFDGDVGHRIDAVLAVAMLNGLTAKGEARRIALSVSRPSLKAAQLADALSTFYAGRPAGAPTGGIGAAREGMIGLPEGPAGDDGRLVAAALSKKTAQGEAAYSSSIGGLVDTAETSVLIRNLILAQHDENAAIVLAGPATGVARILGLYRSEPQLVAKVRHLVVAAGAYPAGSVDPSIKADVPAARKLFADWPTPLVAVGLEVGDAIPYPAASIENDFGWASDHPVLDVYRAAGSMPYDAPAAALAATLYAAHSTANYFKLSEPGTISVLDDGRTQFSPAPEGRHRYLIVDPAHKETVTKLYTTLVSAPPAPRPGRGGRGVPPAQQQQQQQQQQQPPQAAPPGAPPAGAQRGAPPPAPPAQQPPRPPQ